MKQLISKVIIILAISLYFTESVAQNRYSVKDVPNVQLQDYTRYVSDPENVLTMEELVLLDERLAFLRDSVGVETAVVILSAIDTDKYGSAKDFATELFNTWGIGNKETHNGLLILLLTADGEREIVFETGYGTEATLTDGFCKLIQTKKMVPYLKDGEYGEGLIVGVEEVEKIFKGTSEFQAKKPLISDSGKIALIWLLGGLIIIFIVEYIRKRRVLGSENPYVAAAKYKSLSGIGCFMAIIFFPSYIIYMIYLVITKKDNIPPRLNCEKCGAKGKVVLKYKPQVVQKALPGQDGMKQFHYICKACNHGHKVLVPYKYEAPQTKSGGGGSSYSSSSRSSSSSRGGSWGGGRSGGGGASTKF